MCVVVNDSVTAPSTAEVGHTRPELGQKRVWDGQSVDSAGQHLAPGHSNIRVVSRVAL